VHHKKSKKNAERITLELTKNPDIISTVKQKFPELISIGFAAETENVIEHAKIKLKAKNLNAIIANDVSEQQVFNQSTTKVSIIERKGTIHEFSGSKNQVAEQIFEYLESLLCRI
jgi:phosphopantothenoylcysteine decarboxylase/phosphopantothenate--cysteine ligase